MHGRRRRRRPAGSGATQGGHLPGAPAPRAAKAPGAWQRGRRALGLREVENAVERRTRSAGGLRRLGP